MQNIFQKNKGLLKHHKLFSLVALGLLATGCATNNEDSPLISSSLLAEDVSVEKVQNVGANLPDVENAAYTLEIIHMNDVHSYIDPLGVTLSTPSGQVRVRTGGSEAENAFIKARRLINPNLLVISAGDQIIGNAANYNMFEGRTDAALHALHGTDFYIYGNHEFDHGGEGLAKFVNAMTELAPKAVLLNSDVTVGPDNALKNAGTPDYIKEVNGKDIAFYGITTGQKIQKSSSPDPDMKFLNSVDVVNKLTEKNKEKTDIHVLVSHNGVLEDLDMIKKLNDVDIIVGGDSHSLFGPFTKYGLIEEAEYPITVTNASGKKACIVQANEYGKVIGDLQVSFDEDGNVLNCGGHAYMSLWADTAFYANSADEERDVGNIEAKGAILSLIAEDESPFILSKPNPEAYKALDLYRQQFMAGEKVLGTLGENLCTTRYPTDTCAIKNTTAIGGSESCQVIGKVFIEQLGKGKGIFLSNSGMFRVDLEKGQFTSSDLLGILPFGNKIVKIQLTGKEIDTMLNQVVAYVNSNVTGNDGGMPCGYGYAYSMRSSGEKPVYNVLVKNDNGEYQPIDYETTYDVFLSDYQLKGKDGYTLLKGKEIIGNKAKDAELIEIYLDSKKIFPKLPEEPTIREFIMNK